MTPTATAPVELARHRVDLPAGPISYREAGEGPAVVFIHGYLVDGRLWDGVAERLAATHRVIVPDWPMGSHREAMKPDADLTPPGAARIVHDFLAELGLEDVTVVANDTGGAIAQILVTRHPERVGKLVLTNCDSHDNFPPFPFGVMPLLARVPGGMTAMAQPFRLGAARRAGFKPFSKAGVDPDLGDSWLEPTLSDPAVRRDTQKVTAGLHKRYTMEALERLGGFTKPVLLAWAPGDRFFPLHRAEDLAKRFPDARLERIQGAATFVAIDQPQRLAELISEFAPVRG
jgi:pimeloyl-ACP methyl ester carboxylesterase